MAGLADFRKTHPEYNDMRDRELADALHTKFYSDMPKAQFDQKMGLVTPLEDVGRSVFQGEKNALAGVAGIPGDVSGLVRSGMNAVGIPTRDPSKPLAFANGNAVTLPGGFMGLGANADSATLQKELPGSAYESQTGAGAVSKLGVELGPLLMAGPTLVKAGVGAAKAGAQKLGAFLSQYDTAAAPIADDIRSVVGAKMAGQTARDAEMTAAERAAAEADVAKRERIVKALGVTGKNQVPEVTSIGTVRNPSAIGAPLQTAALGNEAAIAAQRGKLDSELRTARDAIVAANEAKGVTIASTPTYKALVARLKPVVEPNAATMPEISQSTDPTVKRLYQEIWERVTPQKVPLTAEQYRQAEQAGIKVKTGIGPNGEETYSRTVMPSFNAVDDTRRFLGQAFADQQSGYSAISGIEKQKLYSMLDDIQKEYVGGAPQAMLQKNWREASERLNMFDTKAGKTLTATQGDTGALRTNAADIPGQFFGKGADRIQHLQDITANPELVSRSAGDWVASQLAGKTGAQAAQALGPSAKLADMLTHPTVAPVARNVSAYVKALNASERTAGRTEMEAAGLDEARRAAAKAGTQAEASQQTADVLYARAAKYDRLAPREIAHAAKADAAADLKAGRITRDQFDALYRKIDEADALHGKTDQMRSTIKKIIIGGAILGAPATIAKTAHLGGL